jgi:DNA polymerase-3 subunit alpha
MPDSQFIHLRNHSAYSLAEGAIKVKDLVKLAVKNNMPACGITDTSNMFGALEFALEAAKSGVQPVIGMQIDVNEDGQQLVLLAQSAAGYKNMSRLISDAYMNSGESAKTIVSMDDLAAQNADIICLTGGLKGPLNQLILHGKNDKAQALLEQLKSIFSDRLYIELQRHGLPEEEQTEAAMIDLAYKHDIPLVATNECFFRKRNGHEAHDALLCISEGRYVTEDDRRKVTKAHYFKSPEEMADLFADIPEAVQNTSVIAQRCSFLLQPIDPILPAFETEGGRSEFEELKAQAEEGLQWRLENFVFPTALSSLRKQGSGEDMKDADPIPDHVRDDNNGVDKDKIAQPYYDRLAYELNVINNMGFPGYFLIVSDFIKWTKDQGIPVGPGRGSGAGSVVAWALKITDLDPLKLGLLFERFLNPERVSMPDFDIDFCQERRDEVIHYVQDKYGRDRVAQIITFGKLQARAVVRDVGRVLQMPYGQVDRIAKMIPNNPAAPMTLQEALDQDKELRAERDKDDVQKKLIDIALQLEGLYRHASTHAAGLVIADRPLHELVPVYRDPRSDMPVTQFNMKYVEQAGLVKFDFLGLKTMTVIQKTVDMVNAKLSSMPPLSSLRKQGSGSVQENTPIPDHVRDDNMEGGGDGNGNFIDILKIPLDDPDAYKLMAKGATVGVFQMESAGMRDTLKKVKPDRFEDIIALVSLYRPGPMDNIPAYAAIKDGKQAPDYMHPKLEPFLTETYGIMIYQEQVMQAAQELAGYTLGGADLLRRAMGKKIQSEMDAQREMFVKGAKTHNNVPESLSSSIFDQIAKFAGYGFNKSHAAAYALIAYWTAWLKAHYPHEFMAASMTLDLGNTDKLAVFKQDLNKMGIDLRTPDINESDALFKVEYEQTRPPPNLPLIGGGIVSSSKTSPSPYEGEGRDGGAKYQPKPSTHLIDKAQELRKNMTDAERVLWHKINKEQLGVKFRRQHPIDPYIVDFICLEKKLIVELDGGQHNEMQKDYDEQRTAFLQTQGYAVLRYWNNEVLENIDGVLHTIVFELNTIPPPPNLPSQGGGTGNPTAIRYALAALKGVGEHAMDIVVKERAENGAYTSLEDFAQRLDHKYMNKRQFERLAMAGAFDCFSDNRAQMAGASEIVLRYAHTLADERESGQVSLFGGGNGQSGDGLGMPALPDIQPWPALERLANEFTAVGFYLSAHPLDSRQKQFKNLGIKSVSTVEQALQNISALRVQMAGVLLKKQVKVSQKGNKYAFLGLSDPSGVFEVTVFSDILFAAGDLLQAGTSLLLTVEAEQKEDQIRYTCVEIKPLEEALEHKIRDIHIELDSAESIGEIKSLMNGGKSRITFHVNISDNRVAVLTLPNHHDLNGEARDHIRSLTGVREIREG